MGLENFQPETFAQANPFLTGMSAMQGMQTSQLQNVAQKYQNEMLQQQVPYAGPMAQAQVGLTQAQIPLTQAQAGLTQAQIPYAGYQALGSLYGGLGRMMMSNQALAFINAVGKNPQMQAVMQNNPEMQQAYENAVQESAYISNGYGNMLNNVPGIGGGNVMNPTGVQQPNGMVQAPQGTPLPGMKPGQNYPAVSAPPQSPQSAQAQTNFQNMQPGQAPPVASVLPSNAYAQQNPQQNASDINALHTQLNSSLMNSNYTPKQQQQLIYENAAMIQFKKLLPTLPGVASYSGAQGALQLAKDRLTSFFGGTPSPQYQSYKNYQTAMGPLAADIGRALGHNSTNEQNEAMNELLNPVEYDVTPKQALSQLQQLMDSVHQNTMAIVQPKAANLAEAANSQPLQVPGAPQNQNQQPQYSDADIAYTAKKYNMTVAQVKQRLGAQ